MKCCIVCALYFWTNHDPILLLNHIPGRNIKVRLANHICRGVTQKIRFASSVAAAGSAPLLSVITSPLAFCATGHRNKEGESDT